MFPSLLRQELSDGSRQVSEHPTASMADGCNSAQDNSTLALPGGSSTVSQSSLPVSPPAAQPRASARIHSQSRRSARRNWQMLKQLSKQYPRSRRYAILQCSKAMLRGHSVDDIKQALSVKFGCVFGQHCPSRQSCRRKHLAPLAREVRAVAAPADAPLIEEPRVEALGSSQQALPSAPVPSRRSRHRAAKKARERAAAAEEKLLASHAAHAAESNEQVVASDESAVAASNADSSSLPASALLSAPSAVAIAPSDSPSAPVAMPNAPSFPASVPPPIVGATQSDLNSSFANLSIDEDHTRCVRLGSPADRELQHQLGLLQHQHAFLVDECQRLTARLQMYECPPSACVPLHPFQAVAMPPPFAGVFGAPPMQQRAPFGWYPPPQQQFLSAPLVGGARAAAATSSL